jgi:DNA-binding transcriptional MerR regulator
VVSAAAGRSRRDPVTMTIGEVLTELRPEFHDVTISKIRFLEEQGLIDPQRTASGYRKFSPFDLQRLRFVLAQQRDNYMPLRVIRDYLDAIDRGLDPSPLPGGVQPGPRLVAEPGSAPPREVRLSHDELARLTDLRPTTLAALETAGLITPHPRTGLFGEDAVQIGRAAAQLAAFGIEPRHLRAFKTAADREAGLIEQVVEPMRHQRGPEASARAEEATRELAALCLRLHAALVKSAIERGD